MRYGNAGRMRGAELWCEGGGAPEAQDGFSNRMEKGSIFRSRSVIEIRSRNRLRLPIQCVNMGVCEHLVKIGTGSLLLLDQNVAGWRRWV